MSSYYDHSYVSNSTLSALKQELSGQDAIEYKDAFRLGTLVDVLITEPKRIDFISLRIDNYTYSVEELENARYMKVSFLDNLFASRLLIAAKFQVEVYRELVEFTWQEFTFFLNCRCKLDGMTAGLVWDLKSTTATTQSGFLAACERFEYYRQAYWYMMLTGATRFAIIGVCKKRPWKVFIVTIVKGDASYHVGEAQANELAFKYWMIKN
jgi:hypothetical protein